MARIYCIITRIKNSTDTIINNKKISPSTIIATNTQLNIDIEKVSGYMDMKEIAQKANIKDVYVDSYSLNKQ